MGIVTESRITLDIEPMAAFEARALEIARLLDRGELIAPQAHISFPDIEALLAVLTPKRFALLQTLRQIGPSSVRALASAVGRDYKAVHTDVAALTENGLIERQAKDRVAVLWDHVQADMRLAA
jgi:predicted transcriptional regulator